MGGAKGYEPIGGDDDDDTQMRAHRRRHMRAHESRHIRAHIWVHTYESRHMRAHIGKHTDESTHRRAHRKKHTYESTHMSAHICTAFSASLRSRNARGHFTKTILCGNLPEKCRTRSPRTAFCASLQSRKTCPKSHYFVM